MALCIVPMMASGYEQKDQGVTVGRDVVIVGAGIVGVSLAHILASRGAAVTVLDRDAGPPRGSTSYAPGFVGLYNDASILTRLARESAAFYEHADGFRCSGGLELATTDAGASEVERRVKAARTLGHVS